MGVPGTYTKSDRGACIVECMTKVHDVRCSACMLIIHRTLILKFSISKTWYDPVICVAIIIMD